MFHYNRSFRSQVIKIFACIFGFVEKRFDEKDSSG